MLMAVFRRLADHRKVRRQVYTALEPAGWIAIEIGGSGSVAKTSGLLPKTDQNIKSPDCYYANLTTRRDLQKVAGLIDIEVSRRPHLTLLSSKDTPPTHSRTLVFREWDADQIRKKSYLLTGHTLDFVRLEVGPSRPQ